MQSTQVRGNQYGDVLHSERVLQVIKLYPLVQGSRGTEGHCRKLGQGPHRAETILVFHEVRMCNQALITVAKLLGNQAATRKSGKGM